MSHADSFSDLSQDLSLSEADRHAAQTMRTVIAPLQKALYDACVEHNFNLVVSIHAPTEGDHYFLSGARAHSTNEADTPPIPFLIAGKMIDALHSSEGVVAALTQLAEFPGKFESL